jgi:four helix bundle protein
MKSRSYRDLIVWQKAMDLTVNVYKLSSQLPDSEKYGLRSQMQRSSSSIPMNIAQGHARKHRPHFLLHLSYAQGSLAELETQLILIIRLEMIDRESITPLWKNAQEIGKMLYSMVEKLRAKQQDQDPKA